MPNLTRLAADSLVFQNAYSVYPESIKGLYSVLFSQFPAMDASPELHACLPARSLAELLEKAGYATALFHSGRFMYLGMDAVVERARYDLAEDAGQIGGNMNSSFGVDEPASISRVLRWLDERPKGRPFFLTYLPIAGHHPYDCPEKGPFAGNEEIDHYLNALHFGDESLGRLFDGLKKRGLFEQTLFVIYGDHGEAFGQHPGNYGHTLAIYEENVHVPILIAVPGVTRQRNLDKVVSLLDLAPTTLHLLGLAPDPRWQGQSMLDPTTRRALYFTDYSLGYLGARDVGRAFIYEIESGRSRLYDLRLDPGEQRDLSASNEPECSALKTQLLAWASAQKFRIAARAPSFSRQQHAQMGSVSVAARK